MLYQLNQPVPESSTWSLPLSSTSASSGSSDLTDLEGWSSGGGSDREGHQDSDAQRGHRRKNLRHRDHPHPPTSDESERSTTEEENLSTPPTSTGSQPGDAKIQKVETSARSDVSADGNRPEGGTESLTTVEEQIENRIEAAAGTAPHVAEHENDASKVAIGETSPKRDAKDVKNPVPRKTSATTAVREAKGRKDKSHEKMIEKTSSNKIVKRKRTPRTKEEKLADLDIQVQKVHKGTHPLFIQRTSAAKIIYESKTRQNKRQLSHSMQCYKDLEEMAKRAGRQWLEAKQLETRQKLIEQVQSMLQKLETDWQTEKLKDAGPEFQTPAQPDYRQVRRQNREHKRIAVTQIRMVTGYGEVRYADEGRERRKRGYEEVEEGDKEWEKEGEVEGRRRTTRRRRICGIGRTRAVEVLGCSPMEAEEDLALMGCN